MSLQRIFYVTQGSVSVWETRDRAPEQIAEFGDDDTGLRRFDDYLSNRPNVASAMLVDVIEEEFKLQSIPRLTWRDRKSLIRRRCASAFRRTPYRASLYQGKSDSDTGQFTVVHSAIVNHELIDPWLQVILRHCTPVCGVYSVPHLAQSAVKRLFPVAPNCLFVAPHQSNKLRQVFLQGGKLRSARLSQSLSSDDRSFAEVVIAEVTRSRRYYERTRLLGPLDLMEVRVVADAAAAQRITELAANDSATVYTFIDPGEAARKLGLRGDVPENRFEHAYFSMLARSQPSQSYATSGETRYWYMQRMRSAAIGASVAVAVICSALASAMLSDTWMLRAEAAEIDAQLRQLSETYRRENERFNPIKADSYEMKLAVDSGDYILSNRVPVPWVMNQFGAVLGDYPDVQARELSWQVESPSQPERRQRPGAERLPIPVPKVNAVDAILTGVIEPFDGDMRRAFSRIDHLTAALESQTHFTSASVIEYPIDTSTAAAVSGELVNRTAPDVAHFRIRVSYRIQPAPEESNDDAV